MADNEATGIQREQIVNEDVVQFRFTGQTSDGEELRELPAALLAETLQGLVELTSDFAKAGTFGNGLPPEVRVRPAREGSFILEVVNFISEHPAEVATSVGMPSLSSVLWWATKSVRADVKDFTHLPNGNVKVVWQDDTVNEIPLAAWDELNKRKRRRKGQLRKIMAPLSDAEVTAVQVTDLEDVPRGIVNDAPEEYVLERTDYHLARPEDEVVNDSRFFETEAQMATVDFEGDKWRVKTHDRTRSVTVEDAKFLTRVAEGLALHKDDIFNLKIREDSTTTNGRTRTTWTVLKVKGHRKTKKTSDGDT